MTTSQDILNWVNNEISPLTIEQLQTIPKTPNGDGYTAETIPIETDPRKKYTKLNLLGVNLVNLVLNGKSSEVEFSEIYLIGVDLFDPPSPLELTVYSNAILAFLVKVTDWKTYLQAQEDMKNAVWDQLALELSIP